MSMKSYPLTYLAYLDILGFSALVDNNDHNELISIYETECNTIDIGIAQGTFVTGKYDGKPIAFANMKNAIVNSLIISDGIILWTDDVSCVSFCNLLNATSMIQSMSFFSGLPLRSAIVVGPLTTTSVKHSSPLDNSVATYFGKSIVDGHRLQAKQNWSGCLIDKSCAMQFESEASKLIGLDPAAASFDYLCRKRVVIKYNVPFRDGSFSNEYVLNWTRQMQSSFQLSRVADAFGMHNKKITDERVREKIKNTEDFLKQCAPDFLV